jgi:nascent polypeptide-associated complex subunit beta
MSELTPEIKEARKRMEEKFGNLKLGGKGTQKRKKIVVHKATAVQDKKIASIAKKTGARNLGETAEINVFRDDHTVLHFKKPKIEYSAKEKITFVTGEAEVKRKFKLKFYFEI